MRFSVVVAAFLADAGLRFFALARDRRGASFFEEKLCVSKKYETRKRKRSIELLWRKEKAIHRSIDSANKNANAKKTVLPLSHARIQDLGGVLFVVATSIRSGTADEKSDAFCCCCCWS